MVNQSQRVISFTFEFQISRANHAISNEKGELDDLKCWYLIWWYLTWWYRFLRWGAIRSLDNHECRFEWSCKVSKSSFLILHTSDCNTITTNGQKVKRRSYNQNEHLKCCLNHKGLDLVLSLVIFFSRYVTAVRHRNKEILNPAKSTGVRWFN